jgi:hypothetical protein
MIAALTEPLLFNHVRHILSASATRRRGLLQGVTVLLLADFFKDCTVYCLSGVGDGTVQIRDSEVIVVPR